MESLRTYRGESGHMRASTPVNFLHISKFTAVTYQGGLGPSEFGEAHHIASASICDSVCFATTLKQGLRLAQDHANSAHGGHKKFWGSIRGDRDHMGQRGTKRDDNEPQGAIRDPE